MTAKIKLNAASGGGSFSIQAPSSSSNNRVFTLPDSADAALLTATATLGKIGQVLTQIYEPGGSDINATSSSYADTGMTLTITPSNTNSKILIFGIANGHRMNNAAANAVINVKRAVSGGSTDNLSGQNLGLAHTYSTTAVTSTIFFVDGTTGTAQRTYTVIHKETSNSYTATTFRANTTNMFMLAEILP